MANPIQEQGQLSPSQKKVALTVLRTGKKMGASSRDLVVALITGIQESGLQNLPIGAETSGGWRQERKIYFPDPTNVKHSAERFFKELKGAHGGSVGEEAQRVQRSAYPSAYQPHVREARGILKQFNKVGLLGPSHSRKVMTNQAPIQPNAKPAIKATTTNVKSSQAYKLAALDFVRNRDKPGTILEFAQQKKELQNTLPSTININPSAMKKMPRSMSNAIAASSNLSKNSFKGHPDARAKAMPGLANFEGTKVAKWIKPYLVYARKHGWKGSISSGYRSYAEQKSIYDSGARPAAVPGTSNHEGKAFPRGAVDVSDAATLAKILKKYPGGSALKWAGSADPVHFSHPHNGGY